ncbi:MAG: hypothetical protein JWN34_776 [Bryobacterales bacterium]|nr:hypothetical protein [Bryobacterales bacterium]
MGLASTHELARNLHHFWSLVQRFTKKGARIEFLKENLTARLGLTRPDLMQVVLPQGHAAFMADL